MKTTRVLSALLALMMIVCALPMMQASAAVPANLEAAVGEILGYNAAVPAASTKDWIATNLDFTADGAGDIPCLNADTVTFDTTDGAIFGEEKGKLYYQPRELSENGVAVWSPFAISGNITFGFKLNENGSLRISGEEVWGSTQMGIDVTAGSVGVWESTEDRGAGTLQLATNLVEYVPGTEWNDVMVTKDNSTANTGGYTVYMKKASETSFTKVAVSNSFCYCTNHGNCYNGGIKFEGKNGAVNYAVSYKGINRYTFDSIETILGQETGSTYHFIFDERTNFANSAGRGGFTADGYKSEADGLTLIDPADTTSKFSFAPFGSYSPLNGTTNWNDQTYEPQALYLKTKGDFELLIPSPKTYGRVNMVVKVGSEIAIKNSASRYSYPMIVQDEWTEFLIVPNELTNPDGWTMNGGYTLYAKADKATNGTWYKIKDYGYENLGSGYTKYGLTFYAVTGHIKEAKTISLSQSVSNASIANAEAVVPYLDEDFSDIPTYPNMSYGSAFCEDGYLVIPATTSSVDFTITDMMIPVGGYAEFKVQYDGIVKYDFFDGSNTVSVAQQSDYGTISGGNGYCANSNTSWRTWRILRSAEGYSIYSQNEGDKGWFAHSVNVTGAAKETTPAIKFNFGVRNGNDDTTIVPGENKLDYIKVYGPASDSALTLIDGYTTKVLADGDTMTYPEAIRVTTTAETGKILVVSYLGKTIGDIQVIDIETEMTDGTKTLDLTTTGASNIRFFLWDGFENIKCLTDDVNLSL